MLSTVPGVLVCIFATFELAVFVASLCQLLWGQKKKRPAFCRIILYPRQTEDMTELLLAALRAGEQFETYEIEAEGRPRVQVQAALAALKAAQSEERWTRGLWRP